jgi:hypothetical protein
LLIVYAAVPSNLFKHVRDGVIVEIPLNDLSLDGVYIVALFIEKLVVVFARGIAAIEFLEKLI